MSREWSKPVSAEEAARRAGGRRAYNRLRKWRRLMRRVKVCELWWDQLTVKNYRRLKAKIARQLGVSRSTICRDIAAMNRAQRNGTIIDF